MDYRIELNHLVQPFVRIFAFFVILFTCTVIAQTSIQNALPLFFGVPDASLFLDHIFSQSNINAILFVMAINTIGIFLLPPLLFFLLFNINPVSFLRLDYFPPLQFWLAGIFTMLASGIFINVLAQWQSHIPLPSGLAALRQDDKLMDQLMDTFFKIPSAVTLVAVTLVVAFLPALAEEIFFRGILQNYLAKTNLGNTGAIIISGLSFSLMHGQIDNLLAIWCMGIVLGLLYYYSGSLWVNVAAHFINNFIIVGSKYAYHSHLIHVDLSDKDIPLYVTLPAGLIMLAGLILLKNWQRATPGRTMADDALIQASDV